VNVHYKQHFNALKMTRNKKIKNKNILKKIKAAHKSVSSSEDLLNTLAKENSTRTIECKRIV
jgi:hypothetical protein